MNTTKMNTTSCAMSHTTASRPTSRQASGSAELATLSGYAAIRCPWGTTGTVPTDREVMGRRVNIDGPGDDPDEYWFECDDCGGSKEVTIPYVDEFDNFEEGVVEAVTCPNCDGLGFVQGDADDV